MAEKGAAESEIQLVKLLHIAADRFRKTDAAIEYGHVLEARSREQHSDALSGGDVLPVPEQGSPGCCAGRLHEEPCLRGKLTLGFRTGGACVWEEDYPALLVFDALYGGTPTSKLFLNVREKLSLCYYAGSTYHRSKGLVTVSSGIEAVNYDRAVAEIMAQLEALKNGQWEDWEFEGAKSSLRNSLLSLEDSAGGLEDYAMGQAAINSDESLPLLLEAVTAVTEERVRQAAACVRPDTIYFLKGKEA